MNKTDFDQIFRMYHKALCIYAAGLVEDHQVAEDLVEEVFIKVWKRVPVDISNIRAYLYSATRNGCLNYLQREIRPLSLDQAHSHFSEEQTAEVDHEIVKAEVFRQLEQALAELPEKRGQVVRMAYMEGLPSKVIAMQMGVSVSTVDNHKASGLSQLRKLLSKRTFQLLLALSAI